MDRTMTTHLKIASRTNLPSDSPHVRESKTVLDSGFQAVDSGFQLLDSRSYTVELGFRIPIVRGIPDSDSCIPDSKAQDSGFHKQKFPRFRILHAKISRIPESGFPYMGRFRLCNGFIALRRLTVNKAERS